MFLSETVKGGSVRVTATTASVALTVTVTVIIEFLISFEDLYFYSEIVVFCVCNVNLIYIRTYIHTYV